MDFVKQSKEFLNRAYQENIAGAKELLSKNVILEMGGNNKLSGTHKGRNGFFANFSRMMELSNGSYEMTHEYDWLNGNSKAVLIAQECAEKDGEVIYFDRVIQYDFDNEKIVRIKIYEGDPANVDKTFR